ncbi:MAG: secondary thiamine-phosphate synthase enzyme YjbQ [Alphaproteobacteria bacterium]|nr:secondary thiamine-phosphate synthase enzyme YjbQ [Alphaproteobacteria bacterium]
MRQAHHTLVIATQGPGLRDITPEVRDFVHRCAVRGGLLTLFVQHTSASLLVQENADPDVCRDLESFFRKLVARAPDAYRHQSEGPDDMPAHIRSALTATSLSIPVRDSVLQLGTWQAIYLFEHRDRPHQRHVALHLIGD